MRILQYHPSVSAYVSCNRNGGDIYYDLSEDIVSCTVNRLQEVPSKFTLHLSNPNGKYSNVFMPMDRVKIYAGKDGEMFPLITGYITSAPQFQLVRNELTLSGADSLYRLQRLYFDPGLVASQVAMGYGGSHPGWDYGDLAYSILKNIAAWPEDQIDISADIPERIINFAKGVYQKQMGDMKWVGTLQDEILNALQTTGPVLTSGGSGTSADLNAPLGAGQTIQLPAGLGDHYTSTGYGPKGWHYMNGSTQRILSGSNQEKVWEKWVAAGCVYTDHIATLNGRWLVACTSTFGVVGDYVTFKLANGQVLSCIIADEKSQVVCAWDPHPANKWGHDDGYNVIEFEVDINWLRSYGMNPGTSGWKPEWGGTTCVSGTNYGSCL